MSNTAKIRELNDKLRVELQGGKIAVTPGVITLGNLPEAIRKLREFSEFSDWNDPHHERDFGAFKVTAPEGHEVLLYFKIDYYDPDLMMGSSDPSDERITFRVLTLLRADEY